MGIVSRKGSLAGHTSESQGIDVVGKIGDDVAVTQRGTLT